MKKTLLVLAAVVALSIPLSAPAGTTATRLTGTTGPGFVVTLKKAGTKVTRLKPGTYTITVSDKSSIHDYWIVGPGLKAKQITGIGFTGKKTVTVKLTKKGRYEFYCKPHRSMGMRGFFTVR